MQRGHSHSHSPSHGMINSVAHHRNYSIIAASAVGVNDAIGHDALCPQFLLLVFKDIISILYAFEASSIVAHPQLAYATDETLLTHTFSYGPSRYASSSCCIPLIRRGLIAFVAIPVNIL